VLAGGGVIGGMYEVGALAALDDVLPGFRANQFDLYVGSSSGSVVSSLMANGIRPRDLYEILDEERDDPLNFQRGSVYHKGAFSNAARNLAQFVWAVGKKAVTGFRLEWPDLLARSGADMPAGFFSVAPLEKFMREAFAGRLIMSTLRPEANAWPLGRPTAAAASAGTPARGRRRHRRRWHGGGMDRRGARP